MLVPAHSLQKNNRQMAASANVEVAVSVDHIFGRHGKMSGNPEKVIGRDKNILPIAAAVSTLFAAKTEGAVQIQRLPNELEVIHNSASFVCQATFSCSLKRKLTFS